MDNIFEIVKYPAESLLQRSENVAINKELQQWIQDLQLFSQTMEWGNIAGLAAPQVGRNIRVFLAQGNIYINPVMEIVEEDGSYIAKEGCYSLEKDKMDYKVKRWNTIWLTYFTKKGEKKRVLFRGYPAQVLQHEYDHIQGILCCGTENL